jgi:hypothetical protein
MRKTACTLAFLVVWMFATPMGWAQNPGDAEHAELAKALRDAKIPLQRGLAASMKEGKPISAKYEVEHGKLQLSVYTMKGDKFSEGDRGPQDGQGGEGGADHRGRRSHGGEGSERGDG